MAGLPWIRAYTSIRTDPRSLVLGRLLGDSHAYARILDLRLWLADNSPSGIITGQHAAIVVEEAVGWRGAPGAFAQAAIDAGFLRNVPARDSEGSGIEDADWVDEQSAHIAKVVRDNNKPDGRKKSLRNPSRIPTESRAAPLRDSSGESRELRVESREETTLAPAPADAVSEAVKAFQSDDFALEAQDSGPKPKKPSEAEALYARLEASREKACAEAEIPFVLQRWAVPRINKTLGAVAKAPKGAPVNAAGLTDEQERFVGAWEEYLADPDGATKEPAWSLSWFMAGGVRSRYEARALRAPT